MGRECIERVKNGSNNWVLSSTENNRNPERGRNLSLEGTSCPKFGIKELKLSLLKPTNALILKQLCKLFNCGLWTAVSRSAGPTIHLHQWFVSLMVDGME